MGNAEDFMCTYRRTTQDVSRPLVFGYYSPPPCPQHDGRRIRYFRVGDPVLESVLRQTHVQYRKNRRGWYPVYYTTEDPFAVTLDHHGGFGGRLWQLAFGHESPPPSLHQCSFSELFTQPAGCFPDNRAMILLFGRGRQGGMIYSLEHG